MTNEEIEKRFQFDLEMGYFKSPTGRADNNLLCFEGDLFATDSKGYLVSVDVDKFVAVLKKIGYKGLEADPVNPLGQRNCNYVILNTQLKVIVYRVYREFIQNKIPDYIKKYRLYE